MLVQKLAALDSGRPLPFNFELVEKLDAHARIVRLQFKTSSFASAVRPPGCKPCKEKSDMTCHTLNSIAITRLPNLSMCTMQRQVPFAEVFCLTLACEFQGFCMQTCAPRDAILQQSWREEEDGTIVVLGHSVHHIDWPLSDSWSWFASVRTQARSPTHDLKGSRSGQAPTCLCNLTRKLIGSQHMQTWWLSRL